MKINTRLLPILILLLLAVGCHPGDPLSESSDPTTCEGCHTNKDMLKKLIPEVTPKKSPKVLGAA